MEPYTWIMDRTAGKLFSELSESQRDSLLEDLDILARHPFREGHYRYLDNVGREIRVWVLSELSLHYRLDHAVREVRVTNIEPALV